MNRFVKSFVLVGAVGLLSACSFTCDKTADYKGGPYDYERTAGHHHEADITSCHWGGDRKSHAYADERTVASDGQPQEDSSMK